MVKDTLGLKSNPALHYDSTDIDECGSGAHDCSSVAVCLNTPGSYNCSCHDGYDGDGLNCTGASLVDGNIRVFIHVHGYCYTPVYWGPIHNTRLLMNMHAYLKPHVKDETLDKVKYGSRVLLYVVTGNCCRVLISWVGIVFIQLPVLHAIWHGLLTLGTHVQWGLL